MFARIQARVAVGLAAALGLAAAPAAAQDGPLDRLQIHGYLSQAYVGSTDLPVIGIGTEPTGSYRRAALQFRYAVSDNDNLVVQFRNRRLGESPLNAAESDVALDWAFYQHRAGRTSLKIGKVAFPRGIYNEIRDAGTILPFYRAPYNFYLEGFETIDGAVLSTRIPLGGFSLEPSIYGGGLEYRSSRQTAEGPVLLRARGERTAGGQLWVNTPVQGVRIGGSAIHTRFDDASFAQNPGEHNSLTLMGSFDASFTHGFVRAEIEHFSVGTFDYRAWYAQAGVRPTEKLSINVQADVANVTLATPGGPFSYDQARDYAVGVNYAFLPNLVGKLEGHRATGFWFDAPIAPTGPAGETEYGIASIAVSF